MDFQLTITPEKNGGNNLTLDPTKISLWASHSLSQSLFHPTHASPGCLPLICQLYSQKFNHSLAMNLPGYFHPISVTPCPTSRYMHCFLDFQDLPYTQCLVLPAKKIKIFSAWPQGFDSSHIDGEMWHVKEEGKRQKDYFDHQSSWLLKNFSSLFREPSSPLPFPCRDFGPSQHFLFSPWFSNLFSGLLKAKLYAEPLTALEAKPSISSPNKHWVHCLKENICLLELQV